jgi:tetratricopeptide (TPR) repeat protein
MKYEAFISYSKTDIRDARDLCRALERYRIPKGLIGARSFKKAAGAAGSRLTIFFPQFDGTAASDSSILMLEESAFLVVLCSRQSARDPRVDLQIRAFKRLGRPQNILAVILDGEPNAADGKCDFPAEDECFPDALKYELGADGELDRNERVEPIAADIRPHKDGRRSALLKIVAGLLGVGFDDLFQREQRRRKRNLAIVMASSFVLMVVLGVLTVRALLSERESRRQLADTRDVNGYIESVFANVDRSALQRMNPKLMSLVLDASESKLNQTKPRPAPDLEAQMRQILGQAYLACGLWAKATIHLQRALDLWGPIAGPGSSSSLISRRDLGEALIGAGKFAEAKELLLQAPPSGMPVVRYELARALALTGDDRGARRLLAQEIASQPQALAQALRDPAFTTIRSTLPTPEPGGPANH